MIAQDVILSLFCDSGSSLHSCTVCQQDAASAKSRKRAAAAEEDEDEDELESGSGEEGGSILSASGSECVEESPAKTPEVRPVQKKQKVII